ncbi:uncharacterized protein LOC116247770 [Nymphaea colorata]|nr:uncharacterized protein LOC116247770 [Nymphaea colorata]
MVILNSVLVVPARSFCSPSSPSSCSTVPGYLSQYFMKNALLVAGNARFPQLRGISPRSTTFARYKSKRSKRTEELSRRENSKSDGAEFTTLPSTISQNNISDSDGDGAGNHSVPSSARETVLQACTLTSMVLVALGLAIRQVSHNAASGGWEIPDCSAEVSFSFDWGDLELVIGLVVLVSTCRFFLLKLWPDFSDSSEAANQQVLGSLELWDYAVVAILPGVSEELLFRGALLPLFGLNWKSALAVGALFGVLHLGNGRRSSFAIWATFVGLVYGMATVFSSSVLVPMASHSLNNLIGGILWRYGSTYRKDL